MEQVLADEFFTSGKQHNTLLHWQSHRAMTPAMTQPDISQKTLSFQIFHEKMPDHKLCLWPIFGMLLELVMIIIVTELPRPLFLLAVCFPT